MTCHTANVSRLGLESRLLELAELMAKAPEIQLTKKHVYACTLGSLGNRGEWLRRIRYNAETEWTPVLDEKCPTNWDKLVWQGAHILRDDARALVILAKDGRDEKEVRELDLRRRTWDPIGFNTALYQGGSISWINKHTTLVSRREGSDISAASRWVARIWRRGQVARESDIIYTSSVHALRMSACRVVGDSFLVREHVAWDASRYYLVAGDRSVMELNVPRAAKTWVGAELTVIVSDSRTEIRGVKPPDGSLYAAPTMALTDGSNGVDSWVRVHACRANERIDNVVVHGGFVLYFTWRASGLKSWFFSLRGGRAAIRAGMVDPAISYKLAAVGDGIVVYRESFLEPRSTSILDLDLDRHIVRPTEALAPIARPVVAASTEIFFAPARDGVSVPYYAVSGGLPVRFAVVSAYGGFGVVDRPAFDPGAIAGCVECGGVYVVACVRGGGSLGPSWHEAGRGPKKLVASMDVLSVIAAVQRRFELPSERIGLIGGSNGALVLWNAITLSDDLFGAVVLQAPLLDVTSLRGHQRAWLGEYSDSPPRASWLRQISPLHAPLPPVSRIPPTLLVTSSSDDRVDEEQATRFANVLACHGAAVRSERVTSGHKAALADAVFRVSLLSYGFLRDHLE